MSCVFSYILLFFVLFLLKHLFYNSWSASLLEGASEVMYVLTGGHFSHFAGLGSQGAPNVIHNYLFLTFFACFRPLIYFSCALAWLRNTCVANGHEAKMKNYTLSRDRHRAALDDAISNVLKISHSTAARLRSYDQKCLQCSFSSFRLEHFVSSTRAHTQRA